MKRTISIILVLFLAFLVGFPISAADIDLVTDEAGILTLQQLIDLNNRADEISEMYACDVAIVVVNVMQGTDAMEAAIEVYEIYDFGIDDEKSGLLLFLSMAERDYAIIAHGYGNTAFTDYGKDVLMGTYVLPKLSNDNYYEAFMKYYDVAAEYLSMARNGEPFDISSGTSNSRNVGQALLVIALISIVIALIICLIFKAQMKTAVAQRSAKSYISPRSLVMTLNNDVFIRQSVVRIPISTTSSSSSSSSSSSGGTTVNSSGYSGSSGKF